MHCVFTDVRRLDKWMTKEEVGGLKIDLDLEQMNSI